MWHMQVTHQKMLKGITLRQKRRHSIFTDKIVHPINRAQAAGGHPQLQSNLPPQTERWTLSLQPHTFKLHTRWEGQSQPLPSQERPLKTSLFRKRNIAEE